MHWTLCAECYVGQLNPALFTLHIVSLPRIVRRTQTLTMDRYVNKLSQATVNSGSIAVDVVVALRTCCLGYAVDDDGVSCRYFLFGTIQ